MGNRKVYHVCTVNGLRIYARKMPPAEALSTAKLGDAQSGGLGGPKDTEGLHDTTKINRLSLGGDK